MPRPVHVAHMGFFNDPMGRAPAELLQAWPTLVDVAEAACCSGVRVSVVQACARTEHLERNGVRYYFMPFGAHASTVQVNAAFGDLLRDLSPDIFHVHGLDFPREVRSLATMAPGVPIVLQDHASRPPRIWRRASWRRAMSIATGIAFCALEQARPFENAGLIYPTTQLYEIPESTSRFVPGDKGQARAALQVSGDPLILWVGHLDANKDPLTVLAGVSEAVQAMPALQLWCCFGAAPLLREVRNRICADPGLRHRVHLLGRVSHERVEQMMRAADVFVLGSHREGSGYSLIEALACGLPPVVTDIPSFRALTGSGAVGKLWSCGDSHSLCAALRAVARAADPKMAAGVRAHFERELSFESLGLKLARMYGAVLERSRGKAVSRLQDIAAIRTP